MAWRIDEHVVRGEIENCERGRVTGRIWFQGRDKPVELELKGNAWHDVAGRRLEFVNPKPTAGLDPSFAARQEGVVGDITASRKVRVLDVPKEDFEEYYRSRKPMPWHWGNSLYLEWFSACNGRVVIESADFKLSIIGSAEWEMGKAEETEQRRANAQAMDQFMGRLTDAFFPPAADSDLEPKPMTEEEAEELHRRTDELADRIQARVEKAAGEVDISKIIREEIDRQRRERGEPDPTPEQLARSAEWMGEMDHIGDESLFEGGVNEREEREHPLAARLQEITLRVVRGIKARGWRPENSGGEDPPTKLVHSVMIAGAKMAGALNGEDWPPDRDICADLIVRLKRARRHLDSAMEAADACGAQKLTDPDWSHQLRQELETTAGETDGLIQELRERLKQGFD